MKQSDFVKIAKRENNKKRGYLVVNPLQGKFAETVRQRINVTCRVC